MGCCGKDGKGTNARPAPEFALRRMAKCGICEHNERGVCTLVKEMQASKGNNKEALVEVGVLMPDAWCPIGHWGQHKEEPIIPGERKLCQWCRRFHDKPTEICHWCRHKLSMEHRNAQRGIGGTAWGSPYDTRLHEVRKRPFTGDTVRHLHFFMYPRYVESTRYHLEQLKKAAHIFNGKRAVCIATDNTTVEKELVDEINGFFTDVYYRPNNPGLRELVGFIDTLKILLNDGENEAICFAHAKGQQPHTEASQTIRKWNDAAYETCVHNWAGAEAALADGFPIAGSFRSVGAFRSTPYKWHYSGSFWWARSAAIAENPNWQQTCNKWWGSESYVGRHWWPDEGFCLFGNHTGGGSLYDARTWEQVDKELERWRYASLSRTA